MSKTGWRAREGRIPVAQNAFPVVVAQRSEPQDSWSVAKVGWNVETVAWYVSKIGWRAREGRMHVASNAFPVAEAQWNRPMAQWNGPMAQWNGPMAQWNGPIVLRINTKTARRVVDVRLQGTTFRLHARRAPCHVANAWWSEPTVEWSENEFHILGPKAARRIRNLCTGAIIECA